MRIQKTPLDNILFLDIETVPQQPNYAGLDEVTQALWEHKTRYQRTDEEAADAYKEKAGIYAEFGKIICISVGYFNLKGSTRDFRVKSFFGEEKILLQAFKNLLDQHYEHPKFLLCAHNGKEFDFPYIARRILVNRMNLPHKLDLFGKKPWEVPHLDTMELWKFGDYKNYTSLKLLAAVFGFPSPKDDIDGSEVGRVFWEENDLPRIATYCEKDVLATVQLLLKYMRMPLLESSQVIHV